MNKFKIQNNLHYDWSC